MRGGVTVLTPRLARSGGTFPEACVLDVWKLRTGRFRDRWESSRRARVEAHGLVLSTVMVASQGHGPRHVLFLVTVSSLLSYTVGITVTASLDLDHQAHTAAQSRSQAAQRMIGAHDKTTNNAIGTY